MPPLSIMIKPVSGTCDMRCRYCFYADVSARREAGNLGVMSGSTMRTLVRRAFAYADGSIAFAFQGGEPLLAGIEFFREFVNEVRARNTRRLKISFAVQTNGLNINDEYADFFAQNGFLVGISLDGPREIHDRYRLDALGRGTYGRVKNAAEILKRHRCEFNILSVVSASAAENPDKVFEELKGYTYMQFIPLIDGFDCGKSGFSLTPEAYGGFLVKMFDSYERAWRSGRPVSIRLFDNWLGMLMGQPAEHCGLMGVCGVYYLIEADGGVYPCDFYVLDEWRLGSINTDGFDKLAASPVARRFGEMSVKQSPECLHCEWRQICRGGCRRDREPYENGGMSLNRFCESYKRFFDERMDRMLEIVRELRAGKQ